MTLDEWLKKHRIPAYRFSVMCGIASSTLYRYLSGERRPTPRNAVKIERATGGEVSKFEAMFPEEF